MIALGILLILYAVMSWVWTLIGQQMWVLLWLQGLTPQVQWSIRGALVLAGVALVVQGVRRRRARG